MKNEDMNIFRKLNTDLNKIIKIYGDAFVFGVFCCNEHKDIEAIIIPTFEEVCLNEPLITTVIDGIIVKDIRLIYNATARGNPEIITALYTDEYIVAPRYEHLYENLLLKKKSEIQKGVDLRKPSEELKTALCKILRVAWNDTSKAVIFIKQLTDAEKVGLEGIIAAIGDEGEFSQAKVAESTGISRLTMTNLVQKIKTHDIGEVQFRGKKGTYIHFYDDTVLNIRGTNNI